MCPSTLPLFPYTTLFRSGEDAGRPYGPQAESAAGRCLSRHGGGLGRKGDADRISRALPRVEPGGGRRPGDRKSTRLNSSHMSISYAVFCLKKKTDHFTQI